MSLVYKYFPFSEGIRWSIKNNKYIIPQIDQESWRKIAEKDFNIVSFGGLFESFFSLSIAEALNVLYSGAKVNWIGNSIFNYLPYINGIAKYLSNPEVDISYTYKYPAPIFIINNDSYFNCLFNYISVKSYNNYFGYKNYKPLAEQLFSNSCLDWNIKYLPQLRRLNKPTEIIDAEKYKSFDFNKPFVFLVPEFIDWSLHDINCLEFNKYDVRSFVAMLNSINLNVVIMSDNNNYLAGLKTLIVSSKLDNLLWLLNNSRHLLSYNVDVLLMGLLIGDSSIYCKKDNKEFSVKRNKKFLQAENKIYEFDKMNALEVFEKIKEENGK